MSQDMLGSQRIASPTRSAVHASTEYLIETAGRIHEQLTILESRLERILTSEPCCEAKSCNSPEPFHLHDILNTIGHRLDDAVGRISSITSRLEI